MSVFSFRGGGKPDESGVLTHRTQNSACVLFSDSVMDGTEVQIG